VALVTVVEEGRGSRVARELAALALITFALYLLLSLASRDAGRQPNLGGPFGAHLAQIVEFALGLQAYLLAALTAWLGRRVSAGTPLCSLVRESAGGAILLIALSAAAGFYSLPGPMVGGTIGAVIAESLHAYVNLSGGCLIVIFTLVGGLALLAGKAPTEVAASMARLARGRARHLNEAGPPSVSMPGRIATFDSNAAPGECLTTTWADSRPDAVLLRRVQPDHLPLVRAGSTHKLPPLWLLDNPPLEHSIVDRNALARSAQLLEQKLAGFGVAGRVIEVQPGPVVTLYKLEPGEGVKVSQIVNLADDLSMALRAPTVRVLAPVPGEAVVGIEVPNRKRETVYLREILQAEEFANATSQLAVALGKDIAGRPALAELAAMPHLLIAGATGTGKSILIHTMLASILFKATAGDVRFILIDPKMLELSVYEDIPHLLVPVVVDPEKAAAALAWATGEMESRYQMMRELGVRNIDGYNQTIGPGEELVELRRGSLAQNPGEGGEWLDTPIKHRRLPKLVIVIDELVDLLLSEGKTVERDVTRLAQKARAAGIHLILATQRPSVDVITGLIKANLPARISLQVTSRVDSRTILDSIGAERLLGAGDMLFMPPGSAKLRRLHAPFVSESELRKLCDFLRAQGPPDYRMDILETRTRDEDDAPGDLRDELYDEALRIVLATGQASISMIQRRLRIGYNRSARMVEQMEREGIVMPADGPHPREVRMRGTS